MRPGAKQPYRGRNNPSPLWGGAGVGVARSRSDVEAFACVIMR